MSKPLLFTCSLVVALVVASSSVVLVAAVSSPLARSVSSWTEGQSAKMAYRETMVPAGSVLRVRFDSAIGSDISRAGDLVQVHVDHPILTYGSTAVPVGSLLLGTVTEVRPAREGGRAYVAISFYGMKTGPNAYPVQTRVLPRADQADPLRDAINVFVPASASVRLAMNRQGAVGPVGGPGYMVSAPGKDVRISHGAIIWVRLDEPVWVRTGGGMA